MPAFCSLLLPSYFSKNYAGKIGASLEMIKFAFAFFVIHHPLARKAGLRYPENTTPAKASPFLETRPTGPPDESWMNYWRNDSEFVYHHDHRHKVAIRWTKSSQLNWYTFGQAGRAVCLHAQADVS